MFYNVMKAKDIIDVENDKFIRKPLMENNESSFNIMPRYNDTLNLCPGVLHHQRKGQRGRANI